MNEITALLALIAAMTVGVVSPGPSFIMVARTAAAQGRRDGFLAALGMGIGGAIFAAAALLGLQALFHAVPTLFLGLRIAGGVYLCYLGYRIFQGAQAPLVMMDLHHAKPSSNKALWLGLGTQMSNPKTAIIYASVFAALLPTSFSLGFAIAVVIIMGLIEALWYGFVALVLSAPQPRQLYLGYKAWVDRAAGVVMFGLGLRLLWATQRS